MLSDDQSKQFEQTLISLTRAYIQINQIEQVKVLLIQIIPLLNSVTKARGAKIIRILIDEVGKTENT